MDVKEWKGYHLFRDWDVDYDQYKEALNFSEVVNGTTLVEKETNTIVDKLPLKIHISGDGIERTKRQVELSHGFFDCGNRIVEWMKDDDNPNREPCNERAKPMYNVEGTKELSESLAKLGI